jgi:hypothetical protein
MRAFGSADRCTSRGLRIREKASGAGKQFFASDPRRRGEAGEEGSETWQKLRDHWEYSHVARAILALVALIALVIAVAL